jgi:hypothetical protein
MSTTADILDYLPPLFGLAIALYIISRLVRIGRYASPAATEPAPSPPPRALWGKARKLRIFNEDAALTRAETEYLTSSTERLQAKANLDRLSAELAPPPAAPTPQPAIQPSLTLAEIEQLLRLVDLDHDTRTELLRVATALIAEKQP